MHQHSHTETNQASVRSTYFPLSLSLYLGFALGLACILATPPFPPARPGTRAVTYTYNYTLQMGGAAGTRDMKRAAGARQVWRSMALKYYLPSFARVRLTVAVLSFVGFVVFLVVLLRPPPSMLIPNLPHTGHKISVVILPSSTTYNLSRFVLQAGLPIITAHIEAEFIVVGGKGKKAEDAVKPLKAKGSHVELVSAQTTPMHTLSEAFNRAHFSQILVYGDDRVPMSRVLSDLVQPVIDGKVDMAMVEYSDKSSLLSLLSFLITGHLAASSNSTVFCLHTAVWQKDCNDLSLSASSASLELLSKCELDSFSSLSLPLISPQQDQLRILAQVHLLYWQLHPIWCTLVVLLAIILLVWWVWFGRKGKTTLKHSSRTLHAVIV